jgi:hypothetical protein
MKKSFLACVAIASAVVVLDAAPAEACGGCFVPTSERTVVTDHRMALSISTRQTVLWDQIRYSGDPAEFAWVLPVRAGAKVELSNDAFFTALDASTQPVVYAPQTYGGQYGCGLTGCGSSSADSAASGGPGPGQVQLISQAVIGPYETVTLRATDPSALRNWLKSHAFAIPAAIEPVIDSYVRESFDFIALRLRPDCGERSMQPVRIVTEGADPTLPLRMVAAGIGARVGLTLYVISEGRWQPQNFPHATVDRERVRWDRFQNKSNYDALTVELMAEHEGRTWAIEYAQRPELFTPYDPRYGGSTAPYYVATGNGNGGATPGLADAYYSQCKSRLAPAIPTGRPSTPPTTQPFTPCRNSVDAGVGTNDVPTLPDASVETDAGASDAGNQDAGNANDAGAESDGGGADAGDEEDDGGLATADAGTSTPRTPTAECLYLDDIDVAMRGLHPQDIWVTRMRASLPANALSAGDLRLEAAHEQRPVINVYYAQSYADEDSEGGGRGSCLSAPKRHRAYGSWTLAVLSALGLFSMLRRRTRR